jgi:hypothetical protein
VTVAPREQAPPLRFDQPLTRHAVTQRLKVLIVSASPSDYEPLKVDVEARVLKKALGAKHLDAIELSSEVAMLADEFANCVRAFEPNVLHYSGYHSDPGGIMLLNDQACSQRVPKAALVHALKTQKNLRLVVLNTCESLPGAKALTAHIDFAVGTEKILYDETAITFVKGFYAGLAGGQSVQSAFDQGITPLLGNCPRENMPQLCSRRGVDPATAVLVQQ